MSDNPTHPYTLEVQPGPKPGTFGWTIRKNGKLAQRSDRTFRTEKDARRDGAKAIEQQFTDAASNTRR
jgi:hypothetical protein